jgi:hypothetical protein
MEHKLLEVVPKSEAELWNCINDAKSVADQWGSVPQTLVNPINAVAVTTRIKTFIDTGVLGPRHRTEIVAILIPLLKKAVELDYNIDQIQVFTALYWVASIVRSTDYEPMRVLGVTCEGMVKKS